MAEEAAEYEEEAEAAPGAYPSGYAAPMMVEYQPSVFGNAVLILAILCVAFGGFMMLCEAAGATANPVVTAVQDFIQSKFPNL
jgi:hypothetical protein